MSQSLSEAGFLAADTQDDKSLMMSHTCCYKVLKLMGKGGFGSVSKCVDLNTGKAVAIKMVSHEDLEASMREIQMLYEVSVLDPSKSNIVRFFEVFEHKGYTCLTSELLDKNLYQLLSERGNTPLSLNEIRPIAQQLFTAFDALKSIGVLHADLKPDNVMLVNQETQPFRVKLIDFGLSLKTSEKRTGQIMQAIGFRAPEILLGLPFSEAIDMWSLGCLLCRLCSTSHLFGIFCEYQQMRSIVNLLGMPADHLLSAGKYTEDFFKPYKHWDHPKWFLKTPEEYQQATGKKPEDGEMQHNNLQDLVTLLPEVEESLEVEDWRAFVSLLVCLLRVDPEQRIPPNKALEHPFITMVHLEEQLETSLYVMDSYCKMTVVETDHFEEEPRFAFQAEAASPGCYDDISMVSVGAEGGAGAKEEAEGQAEAQEEEPQEEDYLVPVPKTPAEVASPGYYDDISMVSVGAEGGAGEEDKAEGQPEAQEEEPQEEDYPVNIPVVSVAASPGSDEDMLSVSDGAEGGAGEEDKAEGQPEAQEEEPQEEDYPDIVPVVTVAASPGSDEDMLSVSDGAEGGVEGSPEAQEEEHQKEDNLVDVPKNPAVAASPGSCDDIVIVSDGTAGGAEAGSDKEQEAAVSQHAAQGEEEDLTSPDEAAPVKKRRSVLKRMRKFFGRVVRRVFRVTNNS